MGGYVYESAWITARIKPDGTVQVGPPPLHKRFLAAFSAIETTLPLPGGITGGSVIDRYPPPGAIGINLFTLFRGPDPVEWKRLLDETFDLRVRLAASHRREREMRGIDDLRLRLLAIWRLPAAERAARWREEWENLDGQGAGAVRARAVYATLVPTPSKAARERVPAARSADRRGSSLKDRVVE
jgi:hypothetical protein